MNSDLFSFLHNPVVIIFVFLIGSAIIFHKNKIQKIIKTCNKIKKTIFLTALFLITLFQLSGYLNYFDFPGYISVTLIFIAILSGAALIMTHAGKGETCLENETEAEKEEENARKNKFETKYHLINKVPLFGKIIKWFYKEGFYAVILTAIILIGLGLRVNNFTTNNFYNDEYQVVGAAATYHFEKEYYLWDWLEGKSNKDECLTFTKEQRAEFKMNACPYTRAWPHTWLIAKSFDIFGISEFSARLPSLVFGLLFILIAYFVGKGLFYSKKFALLLAAFVIISPFFTGLSQYTRMYALWCPIFLLSIYLIYKGVTGTNKFKTNNALLNKIFVQYFNYDYRYMVSGLILLYLSYLLHVITLVSLAAFWLLIIYYSITRREKKYTIPAFLGAMAIAALFIILKIFHIDFFQSYFITIKSNPSFEYLKHLLDYPFAEPLNFIVVLLSIILLFSLKNKKYKQSVIFLSVMVVVPLIFFIFFANRYVSKMYISNIIAVMMSLSLFTYYFIIKTFKNISVKILLSIILIANMGIILSEDYMLKPSEKPLFKEAYSTVINNYNPDNDVILGQYLRPYYLKGIKTPVNQINMLNNKKFTYEEFLNVIKSNESGWVTWETGKTYHLDNQIYQYICDSFQHLHGNSCDNHIDDTKVEVFYFTKNMVK